MPKKKTDLSKLSLSDLQRLVAQREMVAPLEKRRAEIEAELAKIDAELKRLVAGKSVRKRAGRKTVARKKARAAAPARKKPGRKKKVAKKTSRKKLAKAVVKETARRTTKKRAAKKSAPKRTLEDVIVQVLRGKKNGMPFQDLLATIQKKKLYATKSSNFANVLRRTLSTSGKVKRTGRGIYDVA